MEEKFFTWKEEALSREEFYKSITGPDGLSRLYLNQEDLDAIPYEDIPGAVVGYVDGQMACHFCMFDSRGYYLTLLDPKWASNNFYISELAEKSQELFDKHQEMWVDKKLLHYKFKLWMDANLN